jgi:hypothetical protein
MEDHHLTELALFPRLQKSFFDRESRLLSVTLPELLLAGQQIVIKLGYFHSDTEKAPLR